MLHVLLSIPMLPNFSSDSGIIYSDYWHIYRCITSLLNNLWHLCAFFVSEAKLRASNNILLPSKKCVLLFLLLLKNVS